MPEPATEKKVHYFFGDRLRIKNERAQGIGEELFALKHLTDMQIVQVVKAKPKKYPFLYDSLTWEDATAADSFRAAQVGQFRRSIQRFVDEDAPEPVVVRAFMRIRQDQLDEKLPAPSHPQSSPRIAVTLEEIRDNSERLVPIILGDALADMIRFRRRYLLFRDVFTAASPAMGSLFDAIDQVEKEIGEKGEAEADAEETELQSVV